MNVDLCRRTPVFWNVAYTFRDGLPKWHIRYQWCIMGVTISSSSVTSDRFRGTVSNAHYHVTNWCTLIILNYRLHFVTTWNRRGISCCLYLPEFQYISNDVTHNWHHIHAIFQNMESQTFSTSEQKSSCSFGLDDMPNPPTEMMHIRRTQTEGF